MQGIVNDLLKPRSIEVEQAGPNRARVSLEPLERGFGHTLGNAHPAVLDSRRGDYRSPD